MIGPEIAEGLPNRAGGGVEVQPHEATRSGYVVSGQLGNSKTLRQILTPK
jgi:hypothetical protein